MWISGGFLVVVYVRTLYGGIQGGLGGKEWRIVKLSFSGT